MKPNELIRKILKPVIKRMNPLVAARCVLQSNRQVVKFTGIGNDLGRTAFYASYYHFLHDIPTLCARRNHDCLVIQNFLTAEFIGSDKRKVFFSREPKPHFSESENKLLATEAMRPHLISFAEEDIQQRMFYAVWSSRRGRMVSRLKRSLHHKRSKRCCVINRYAENNRFNLLAERLRFIQGFGGNIDIYGYAPWGGENKWEQFPNYRGPTPNKHKTLKQYDFNLCFENCDEDGYITEKIFHALIAGCVPLYWGGGTLLQETIPSSCYINCRNRDPAEVHQRIKTMPQEEIMAYRNAGIEFIASADADRFSWQYWARTVLDCLGRQKKNAAFN